MSNVTYRDGSGLLGALILGFAFFLTVNYLSLFGAIQPSSVLHQQWLLITVGVLLGYGVRWALS